MQRAFLFAAALASALAAGTGAVQAAPIGGPQTLTVAGVTFSDFECTITGAGTALPGACGQIEVGANAQGDGLLFSSGFTASSGGHGFSFSDAVISFRARAVAGITGVALGFNGTFLGNAVSSVTETIRDAATNAQVAFLEVFCDSFACERNDPVAGYMTLDRAYTDLWIEKDINVSAFEGRSQMSIIRQGYTTAVPEPASMALLGVGLLGLALGRGAPRSGARRVAAS